MGVGIKMRKILSIIVLYVLVLSNTVTPVLASSGSAVPTSPATNANNAVRPVLECVVRVNSNSYIARFGYQNDNSVSVTIPIGNNNKFSPNPQGRGQPTVFLPGRQRSVFEVPFNGSNLVWSLKGPDNQTRTSTASNESTRCFSATPTPSRQPSATVVAA